MKKKLVWIGKAAVAFALAFALLTGVCYFYYNLPVHYTNPSGATDYKWGTGRFTSRGTEGFAYTYTDENGFVNTFPHKKDTVDVLVMGSSHTEGFNVGAKENYTYVLNKMLYDNGQDLYAYSIGMSAHALPRCLKNLEAAIDTYAPTRAVVIETGTVELDIDELKQLCEGTFPALESHDSGIKYYLQKSGVLRLALAQFSNARDNKAAPSEKEEPDIEEYTAYLEQVLSRAGDLAKQGGCQLVLVYTPAQSPDYNGDLIPQETTEKQALFAQLCEKYGIRYIDMAEDFAAMYEQTNHLPHGFSNTRVGMGHLNRYGHDCVARRLYAVLTERG